MSDDLHQTSSGKRPDVISWDEFFMSVAIAAQRRSKDPNTQVGACIASTNHRILSVGYNGTPIGAQRRLFPVGYERRPAAGQAQLRGPCRGQRRAQLPWLAQGPRGFHGLRHAVPVPRLRQDFGSGGRGRGRLPTTSTPTPMTAVSAAAFSTPVASATARSSSMSRLVPGDRLDSNMRCRYLTTNAARRAPSQIDYS